MNIIEINNYNISFLQNFLKNDIPKTFRYFNKRNIKVIENHFLTVILIVDNREIGYAHIDFDDGKYWFGICILSDYQGKGYGKKLIQFVLNNSKLRNIKEIYLSVDKINENAIKLYKNFNFIIISETETYFIMKISFNTL